VGGNIYNTILVNNVCFAILLVREYMHVVYLFPRPLRYVRPERTTKDRWAIHSMQRLNDCHILYENYYLNCDEIS
jgi:hypothetical protein